MTTNQKSCHAFVEQRQKDAQVYGWSVLEIWDWQCLGSKEASLIWACGEREGRSVDQNFKI